MVVVHSSFRPTTPENTMRRPSIRFLHKGAVFFCLVLWGPFGRVDAQTNPVDVPVQQEASKPLHRNVVRLDVLAPLAASLEYALGGGSGAVVPVLLSYERRFCKNGSMGVEFLIRGGTPGERRSGGALLGRWYFAPKWGPTAALAGFYLSPVLSYRALGTSPTVFNTPINSGRRGGAGLLLGWQLPLGRAAAPHLVFDFAVGVLAWTRLGNDRTSDPSYYATVNEPIFKRTGLLPDARYGLGFQF